MEMRINTYYRNRLNDREKHTYDALVPQWMHMYPEIRVPNPGINMKKIIHAVHNDYPVLFYVQFFGSYSYTISPGIFKNPGEIKLRGLYLYDKETARALLDQCLNWGKAITNRLSDNIDHLNRALWLYEVMTQNMVYGELDLYEAHTIVGAVRYNKAVCEGYARSYKFLCDLADIPCITVTGELEGGLHAWNIIWINGEPSHVDITDGVSGKGLGNTRKSFLRNDEDMKILGYSWDTSEVPKTRIHNLSNPLIKASSKSEVAKIVRTLKKGDAVTIVLDYPMKRNAASINKLIQETVYKSLLPINLKSISYSDNYKFLFIEK